jgi:hypothetical protein
VKLANELDGLSLALAVAGAYIDQTARSFSDYLRLYSESWVMLKETSPELSSYGNRALYSTWQISFDNIKQQSPHAANLLRLWAYFDNQDLWFELLRHGDSDDPEWTREFTKDELSFDGAVRVLSSHELIEVATSSRGWIESKWYSIHGCVHSWTIHALNQGMMSVMATHVNGSGPANRVRITKGDVDTGFLEELQTDEQRRIIDTVAQVRKCGLESVLSLPQLVVCGDQSAGKSSVLEALTEIPFPRNEDLCTRFATEIILRRAPNDSLTIKIIPDSQRPTDEQTTSSTADILSALWCFVISLRPGCEQYDYTCSELLYAPKSLLERNYKLKPIKGLVHRPDIDDKTPVPPVCSAASIYYMFRALIGLPVSKT